MYATTTHAIKLFDRNFPPLIPQFVTPKEERILRNQEISKFLELSERPNIYRKKYYLGCDVKDKKIVIKRIGGIGDVIFTLPAAKKLSEMGAEIYYCVQPRQKQLFENIDFIKGVTLREHIRMDELNGIDYILDFYSSIENGYKPADWQDAYDTMWEWTFGEFFNGTVDGILKLTDKEKTEAKKIIDKPGIAICLKSSSPKRTYYYWDIVIEKLLNETDKQIIVLSDFPVGIQNKRIKNLSGYMDLRKYLGIIWACDCIIAPDSGNIHVAAQFNKPTIALFSTVDYKTRTKYYPNCKSIQTKTKCSPCVKLAEYCPKEAECMGSIMPDEIIKAFKEMNK